MNVCFFPSGESYLNRYITGKQKEEHNAEKSMLVNILNLLTPFSPNSLIVRVIQFSIELRGQ